MMSVNVGSVEVRVADDGDGQFIRAKVSGDIGDAEFEFQSVDRKLDLTFGELHDFLSASAALNGMLGDNGNKMSDRVMPSRPLFAGNKVEALTHADIVRTAQTFHWSKKMPKWTVLVNNREFPLRPLVTDAAGVPPNYPTNSHRSAAKLKSLGFDVRYEGNSI